MRDDGFHVYIRKSKHCSFFFFPHAHAPARALARLVSVSHPKTKAFRKNKPPNETSASPKHSKRLAQAQPTDIPIRLKPMINYCFF